MKESNTSKVDFIFDSALQLRQPLAANLLAAAVRRKCLANAYLLTGSIREDKWKIAEQLAAFLNCSSFNDEAKGRSSCLVKNPPEHCANCSWIAAHNHPGVWYSLLPEGAAQKIPVEKVRNLVAELVKQSPYHRIIVIPNVAEDTFHRPAANALLKHIEEPCENSLFILFADSKEEVLQTIVSRCQVLPVMPVAENRQNAIWLDSFGIDNEENIARLSESINKLFAQTGKTKAVDTSNHTASVMNNIEIVREIKALLEENEIADNSSSVGLLLLDLFVYNQVNQLKEAAAHDKATAVYLQKLLGEAEKAKSQIASYVKIDSVMESFFFAVNESKEKLGEINRAS